MSPDHCRAVIKLAGKKTKKLGDRYTANSLSRNPAAIS